MGAHRLEALVEAQRPALALWVPVFFGFGIAGYFAAPLEPDGWMLVGLGTAAAGALVLYKVAGPVARVLLLAALLPCLGFGTAALRSRQVAARRSCPIR